MSLITPDFGLIFWMVLIFAIVFLILAKFGFPIITRMVDARADRIDESIAKAKEAERKLSELSATQEEVLAKTRQEQARLLKEASATREAMLAKAQEEARAESEKILAQARTEIAAEKESALRDIRRQVALLSVDVAEKVLRDKLSSQQAQTEYVEKIIDEVSGK